MIPADWRQHVNERVWLPTPFAASTLATLPMRSHRLGTAPIVSCAMAVTVRPAHYRFLSVLPAHGGGRCAVLSALEVGQC